MTAAGVDLIVDGDNLLVRCLKVAEHQNLYLSVLRSTGEVYTSGLHLFINTLARHVRTWRPEHLLLCWDGGVSDYRRALFPAYKANRAPRPEREQEIKDDSYDLVHQFCDLAGIPQVQIGLVEADDLIAALWRRRRDAWFVILSADRDFCQLLDPAPPTVLALPDQGVLGHGDVVSKWGCQPHHLPLVRALTGDVSDGIPGVHRCGPKTAAKWLATVDFDLERLLADPPKLLAGNEDLVRRNLALMDLRTPLAGELNVAYPAQFTPRPASPKLLEFVRSYRLDALGARLAGGMLWHDLAPAAVT